MKHQLLFIIIIIGLLMVNGFSYAETGLQEKAFNIFKRNCVRCHGGLTPARELNLEPGEIMDSAVNVNSMGKTDLKIINTEHPCMSYLLMKIKNERGIAGKPMPLKEAMLPGEEIKIIEHWIFSLQEDAPGGQRAQPAKSAKKPPKNAFWGTRVINLTTPTMIPKGHFLFRVTHRYTPSIKEGYDYFFGLDGPATIFFSLGYGLTRNLDVTIGRSNLYQEVELMLKWRVLSPPRDSSFPLSLALHAGIDWVTQTVADESAFDSDKFKYNIQLSAAYAVTPRIALLVVPMYTSNANHWAVDPEGTFALGTGLRVQVMRNLSLIGEWLPVLSGYETGNDGWGAGLEYRIGKHLFQLFVLNSVGITIDQFIGGGDLCLSDGDLRFGFSIYREF